MMVYQISQYIFLSKHKANVYKKSVSCILLLGRGKEKKPLLVSILVGRAFDCKSIDLDELDNTKYKNDS